MDAFLREVSGFLNQYAVEIMLWIVTIVLGAVAWYLVWPTEQLVIAGAVSVAYLGAVASAQPHIVLFLKSRKQSRRKKK